MLIFVVDIAVSKIYMLESNDEGIFYFKKMLNKFSLCVVGNGHGRKILHLIPDHMTHSLFQLCQSHDSPTV